MSLFIIVTIVVVICILFSILRPLFFRKGKSKNSNSNKKISIGDAGTVSTEQKKADTSSDSFKSKETVKNENKSNNTKNAINEKAEPKTSKGPETMQSGKVIDDVDNKAKRDTLKQTRDTRRNVKLNLKSFDEAISGVKADSKTETKVSSNKAESKVTPKALDVEKKVNINNKAVSDNKVENKIVTNVSTVKKENKIPVNKQSLAEPKITDVKSTVKSEGNKTVAKETIRPNISSKVNSQLKSEAKAKSINKEVAKNPVETKEDVVQTEFMLNLAMEALNKATMEDEQKKKSELTEKAETTDNKVLKQKKFVNDKFPDIEVSDIFGMLDSVKIKEDNDQVTVNFKYPIKLLEYLTDDVKRTSNVSQDGFAEIKCVNSAYQEILETSKFFLNSVANRSLENLTKDIKSVSYGEDYVRNEMILVGNEITSDIKDEAYFILGLIYRYNFFLGKIAPVKNSIVIIKSESGNELSNISIEEAIKVCPANFMV